MFSLKKMVRALLPQRVWTWLRLTRLRYVQRLYRPRNVLHSYAGFPLHIHLADALAQGWYDHDWAGLSEITFLQTRRLKPGARVFDLGAHQCIVALILARTVGPEGQVVAVEANPHNVRVARQNRDLNQCDQLVIRHAAVKEASGTALFNFSLNGQIDDGTGEWGTQEVPAISVDDLTHEYGSPDVLFVDVEGCEVLLLQGAAQTLAARPDCFVEVHVGCGLEQLGGSVDSVLSFFPEESYERFISCEQHRQPIPLAEGFHFTRDRFFLIALSRADGRPKGRDSDPKS